MEKVLKISEVMRNFLVGFIEKLTTEQLVRRVRLACIMNLGFLGSYTGMHTKYPDYRANKIDD